MGWLPLHNAAGCREARNRRQPAGLFPLRVLYSPPSRRGDAEHAPEHQAQKPPLDGVAPLFAELLRSVVEFATDACGQSSCRPGLFVLYW